MKARGRRTGRGRDMLLQYKTSVAHHHEDKVQTHSPESANHDDAVDALRLQDAVPETGARGSRSEARRANRHGFRARTDALVRCHSDIDVSDVESWGRKAGRVVDGFTAGSRRLAA